ncbi:MULTISPECIES: hypothetical protein [Spirulina sp. CCY15215]|uniref:hypothetical protein n=1 Tax=Spirulina sp. CCY15215 TaxID=2767591 RepID=UPI00194E5B76|nr:hypothetical protein [Spirulina major]
MKEFNQEFHELSITPQELEEILHIDAIANIAIDFYRGVMQKKGKYLVSTLLTELGLMAIAIVLILPTTAIVLQASGTRDRHLVFPLFTISFSLIGLILLAFNLYCWQKAKQLKSLTHLLSEIEKYNRVVHSVTFVDRLNSLKSSDSQPEQNRLETFELLQTIRHSLITALNVEQLMREQTQWIPSRYELLATLESDLDILMAFTARHDENDNSQLFNEALQIGLNVHKEIKKFQRDR